MGNIRLIKEGPSLVDIPGQLRKAAEDIESGVYDDVLSANLVLTNDKDDWPIVFGWGQTDVYRSSFELDLARQFLMQSLTSR